MLTRFDKYDNLIWLSIEPHYSDKMTAKNKIKKLLTNDKTYDNLIWLSKHDNNLQNLDN
ncbi:hypothetical protein CLOSCI_04078 [[Clostridium] scindens ATCC 35704]|nr:hypothetical protein CLOSCI_04078 [[Clostridium] scindens ATCC 35704]